MCEDIEDIGEDIGEDIEDIGEDIENLKILFVLFMYACWLIFSFVSLHLQCTLA